MPKTDLATFKDFEETTTHKTSDLNGVARYYPVREEEPVKNLRKFTLKPDLFEYSKQLKSSFKNLDPIGKARVLKRGKVSGLSNRTLAQMAGIGDGSVRNLTSLLDLPRTDQLAIAAGAPYRPYLTKLKVIRKKKQAAVVSRQKTAMEKGATRGAQALRTFFQDLGIGRGYAEQVLENVAAHLRGASLEKLLAPSDCMWAPDAASAFSETKPTGFDSADGIDRINLLIKWVCRAVVRLIPNEEACDRAVQIALSMPL
jgi:hypothetical protein